MLFFTDIGSQTENNEHNKSKVPQQVRIAAVLKYISSMRHSTVALSF